MFFGLFHKRKTKPSELNPIRLRVDMHSHLLPGIDDGAQQIENTVEMAERFFLMGYQKLITTPHVMWDYYRNSPEIIEEKLLYVREVLKERGIAIEIEAAAEYYLDEYFMELVRKAQPLLCFGQSRYVLFETSYMAPSQSLHRVIFELRSLGYQPILAHPERYTYFFNKWEEILEVREKGCLLQVNANSLTGYYSKTSKFIAEKLIESGAVSFLGSDCHRIEHLAILEKALCQPAAHEAEGLLLNNSLL
jgi:tyrosine-protein phosphatase YwqE